MFSSTRLLHLLPPELLLLTADHLSTRDLSVLSRVCHHLHSSLASPLAERFAAEPTAILIWAVFRKNMTIVKRALAEGADPDGDDYECPLTIAVAKVCSIEIASVLLDAGADVDKRVRTFHYSGEHAGAERDELAELLHMLSEEIGHQSLDDDSGSEESETDCEDDSSPEGICCTGHW